MEKNIKAKILLIEDDKSLGTVISDYLKLCGYEVDLIDNGRNGLQQFQKTKYNLCIFDVMLPEIDGFTIAEAIRKRDETTPIIFLTAKAAQEDKLRGFRIGADDYIVKPFNIEELVLRISVFLRRANNSKSILNYTIGDYLFDYINLCLSYKQKSVNLTQREADLLQLLYIHKEELLKRATILQSIWGNDDYFSGRSLDVFISKLRKYLKNDTRIEIQNFHAVGFKLTIKE
jgi:DNA-binding response OmpR family regulator